MSKKTFKKPRKTQFLYFLLMFISGGILFYIKTLPDSDQNLWIMLSLLIVLMFSLMKSTQNWAYDNPKKIEEEDQQEMPGYKNRDIPTLEEMTKNIKKKSKDDK